MIASGKENRSPFTGVVKRTGDECRDFGRKKKRVNVWIQNVVCSVLKRTTFTKFLCGFFFPSSNSFMLLGIILVYELFHVYFCV